MKNYKIKTFILLTIIIFSVGCKKEYKNPNNPVSTDILETREGLITLSIGMKQFYSTSALEALVVTPGTSSRETKGITTF